MRCIKNPRCEPPHRPWTLANNPTASATLLRWTAIPVTCGLALLRYARPGPVNPTHHPQQAASVLTRIQRMQQPDLEATQVRTVRPGTPDGMRHRHRATPTRLLSATARSPSCFSRAPAALERLCCTPCLITLASQQIAQIPASCGSHRRHVVQDGCRVAVDRNR